MQEIAIGPLLLSTRQLIPIVAMVLAALIIRFVAPFARDDRRRALDIVSNGGLLFLLAWKLTPVLTETTAIVRDPRVLLVAPGGRLGIILGVAAVGLYVVRLWITAGRPAVTADTVRAEPVIVLVVLTGIGAMLLGLGLHGVNLAVAGTHMQENGASEFTLESTEGESVSLSDYRGKVVVLNFWATWCVPCRAESEIKNRIASEYDSNDLVVLGVNLTSSESGREVVAEYARRWDVEYPVLLDFVGEVASAYNVRGTPTTVFIDAEGRVSDRYFGALSLSAARRLVEAAGAPAS